MIIVLISGKQGSGKSTLRKKLQEKYPELVMLRFAQPIYEIMYAWQAVLKKYNYQPYNYEEKDGEFMQVVGGYGRKRDKNMWVGIALEILRGFPPNAMLAVEDCRYENEFDVFMNVPGLITVRLEAARSVRKSRAESWRDNENDQSEINLDHYAAMGKFDILLHSDKQNSDEIARAVIERIEVKKQNPVVDIGLTT